MNFDLIVHFNNFRSKNVVGRLKMNDVFQYQVACDRKKEGSSDHHLLQPTGMQGVRRSRKTKINENPEDKWFL